MQHVLSITHMQEHDIAQRPRDVVVGRNAVSSPPWRLRGYVTTTYNSPRVCDSAISAEKTTIKSDAHSSIFTVVSRSSAAILNLSLSLSLSLQILFFIFPSSSPWTPFRGSSDG